MNLWPPLRRRRGPSWDGRAGGGPADGYTLAVEPDQGWIDALGELREREEPCVLVVVTALKGSTPREPGARMIVARGDLVHGTIGGGNLERLALERAAELLADEGARSLSV